MAQAAMKLDPKTALFRRDFAANAADFPGAGLGWLDERRGEAMEAFGATGMPTRRIEAWKYTDLAAALEGDLEPATPFRGEEPLAPAGPFASANATEIVLVNGYLHYIGGAALSDALDVVDLAQLSVRTPDWVARHLGARAAGLDQVLGAASLALMRSGVAVRVRAGAVGLPPLHLRFVNPARTHALMSHSRVLIVLEEGASLELIESHTGGGDMQLLANIGAEIELEAGAKLDHTRLQEESRHTLHVASAGVVLAENSRYRALLANLGARLARVDMNIRLDEPGAEAQLHSVTVEGGESLADVTTVMDHAAPHTRSRQLFKSVLGGRARSVSQGRVCVREGAVKSDSHQLFKALLLAPRAEADAKPELEIFADDVLCGHGTAIGALDETQLFYLRSRGVPDSEARTLLVRAFLEDAIEGFAGAAVYDALWARIGARLDAIAGEKP